MQTPVSWPTSKKELLVLIPKLRKVPEDKTPEFYGEVARNFLSPAKDELELDAEIDDLVNGIECFCDEDDAHYQRKMGICNGSTAPKLIAFQNLRVSAQE